MENQTFPANLPSHHPWSKSLAPRLARRSVQNRPAPGVLGSLDAEPRRPGKKPQRLSWRNRAISKAKLKPIRLSWRRRVNLEEELTRLQGEPEAGADLDAEIAIRQRRIDRGQAFDRAVYDYNFALGRYQDTLAKLAAAEQEVIYL